MTITNGVNQSYARLINNELVLNKIKEKKEISATLISQETNLSSASVSSIIKELLNSKIIKISKSESVSGVGRKQVYYSLNEEYGLVVVVSLSDKKSRLVITNIKEEILFDISKKIEVYNRYIIYELILEIKKLVETSKYKDIPIKHVIVSVPGRVSKNNELQLSKHFDKDLFEKGNTILDLFEKYFTCDVEIYNDIALQVYGEKANGLLEEVENALLVHIDEGIGSVLLINGTPYRGENGFAGEIGLIKVCDHNKTDCLDEFVSLRALKEKNNCSSVEELVTKYKNDTNACTSILDSAALIGSTFKDLQEYLNVSKILVSGRVKNFGKEYLNILQNEVDKAFASCPVQFSDLGNDASILGGINRALNQLIKENSACVFNK